MSLDKRNAPVKLYVGMAQYQDISDVLRRAIQDSGLSLSEIARSVDIDPGRISRFTRRERSLTLPAADRLAKYFKLRLTRLGGKRHA